jgi:pSer/pThr/pTyr-binding forkhead associated (FHA) protein
MPESRTAERETFPTAFGAPHVFVLAVVEGRNPSAVYRLEASETVIGRGDQAALRIDHDDEVSKRHCAIRVDGPVCTLLDLGSLNGTRLNCRPVRPGVAHRLRHLDELQIGETRLLFLAGRFNPTAPDD